MSKRLLYILVGICAIAIGVMIAALIITGKPVREPFTPPEFDSSAMIGAPDVPANLDWKELDAKLYKVGICGALVPDENGVDLWLTNPKDNNVWLKVRVLDADGNILGETGLIKPGEYVQTVGLQTVPPTGTQITLKVMAYEPETYYSAGAVNISTKIS